MQLVRAISETDELRESNSQLQMGINSLSTSKCAWQDTLFFFSTQAETNKKITNLWDVIG